MNLINLIKLINLKINLVCFMYLINSINLSYFINVIPFNQFKQSNQFNEFIHYFLIIYHLIIQRLAIPLFNCIHHYLILYEILNKSL